MIRRTTFSLKYNRQMKQVCFLSVVTLIVFSCHQQHHTPKPSGYFRIDTGEHRYRNYNLSEGYGFLYSQQAEIVPVMPDAKGEEWFDIYYPAFQANIHCSYFKINRKGFAEAAEDSRNFVYRHSTMADNIDMTLFTNKTDRIYGTLYEIEGRVASPIQFTLSDSVSFFFRGALYFNETVNRDSIAPILNFVREDIYNLMDSFRKESK